MPQRGAATAKRQRIRPYDFDLQATESSMAPTRTLALALAISAFANAALAQPSRPATDTQRVVFVCEHGSVKSMIAANLFNRIAAERGLAARAITRGTAPDSVVPSLVRKGLHDDGIDIGNVLPVALSTADGRRAKLFVAFDVDVPAAVARGTPVRRWDGTPSVMKSYVDGRAAIAERVTQLVDELARPARRAPSTRP